MLFRSRGENILIHEFAHLIHLIGIVGVEPDFNSRLEQLWLSAKNKGLWQNTYAISNKEEYFAEGVQSFFKCNRFSETANGVHGPVNNRQRLSVHDPELFSLLKEYFYEIDIPIFNEIYK